jgi:hypothetical protein
VSRTGSGVVEDEVSRVALGQSGDLAGHSELVHSSGVLSEIALLAQQLCRLLHGNPFVIV